MNDWTPEDVHSEERDGLKLRIVYDTDPPNPREWDNLGILGIGRNRSKRNDPNIISLPVYAYIHSGVRLRTGSFQGLLPEGHAEFDSGLAGLIWTTKEKIRENFMVKRISKKTLARAIQVLEGEINDLNNYFSGSVYGFIIEDEDEVHLDSCWGFLEDYQSDIKKMYVYQEALGVFKYYLKEREKERAETTAQEVEG
jgi:hypothetical protein